MAKKSVDRLALTLKEKQFITPHFIRIILTGENIETFKNTTIGDNNKIFIPPAGVNEIHFPEYDSEANKWIYPAEEVAPSIRTYTHRGIDLNKKELIIDFANHGETGPASAWALNSKVGDVLGVAMRNERSELYPEVDFYLLVGDATAIPVLGAILETLPETAKGIAIIEVHGEEDKQDLFTKAAIDFQWIYNPEPENGSKITDFVKKIELPENSKFAYVATEFASVKEIRNYLRKEKSWTKEELYAYSYWKSGVAEDKSVNDRQSEKNSI